MSPGVDLEEAAQLLDRAGQGLRKYRGLVSKILGDTPEEVRQTLQIMKGLTPSQIRVALEEFRSAHTGEVPVQAAPAEVA